MTTTSPDTLEALTRRLPDSTLITDDDVLASISSDEAEWAEVGRAVAAVRARSTAEVQQVVAACAELRVPVVTRGAGTGLSGGANAVEGGIVLDWVGVLAPSAGPGLTRARAVVYRLTEPVIAPVRRVVPPLRIGGMAIDLAFTIVFVAVIVLRAVVVRF